MTKKNGMKEVMECVNRYGLSKKALENIQKTYKSYLDKIRAREEAKVKLEKIK